MAARIDRLEAFDSILIDHPRRDDLEKAVRRLMRDTAKVIERNDRRSAEAGDLAVVLDELWVLPVVGPSGATKTWSLRGVVDAINKSPDVEAGTTPIQYVKLRQTSWNAKALHVQVLESYKDAAAKALLKQRDYSEAAVNIAIRDIARTRKTVVIVLDEAHSPLHKRRDAATAIGTALKSIVNDAVFSIVVAGTNEVAPIVEFEELQSRVKLPVDFGRFELTDPEGLNYFLWFANRLDEEMVEKKVITSKVGLTKGISNQARIYDMANGMIGAVGRILRLAVERIEDLDPDCERDLDWNDISVAFRAWTRQNKGAYDPFGQAGAKPETTTAMKANAAELARLADDAKEKAASARNKRTRWREEAAVQE